MWPFDRFFSNKLRAADLERIAQGLPIAPAAPSGLLKRLGGSSLGLAACDAMDWSLWQDKRTGAVWVHCSGGIADVNVWYGPGDRALAPATAPPSP